MPQKESRTEYHRKWYKLNRERVLARCKEYGIIHKAEKSITMKKWRQLNKERIAAVDKIWKANNKDRLTTATRKYEECHREQRALAAREHRKNYPDKVALSQKQWHAENYAKVRGYVDVRRLRIIDATEGDVSVKELLESWDGLCGICGKAVTNKYHIDHIVPLSKGGKHAQSNLQVTHPRCNLVKGSKLIIKKETA